MLHFRWCGPRYAQGGMLVAVRIADISNLPWLYRPVVNQLLSVLYLFASSLLLEQDAFKLVHRVDNSQW